MTRISLKYSRSVNFGLGFRVEFLTISEIAWNILFPFCTTSSCEEWHLDDFKPKYTITLIDIENVAYPVVSNMRPRLDALGKNREEHPSYSYANLCKM